MFNLDERIEETLHAFQAKPLWTPDEERVWLALYQQNTSELEGQLRARFTDPQRLLLQLHLTVRLAETARQRYLEAGIPLDIWRDTFSDIGIWVEHTRIDYGCPGLANIGWLRNHIALEVFRLGRLQYQPVLWDEVPILNVHISEGEPLAHADCLESYRRAVGFFRDRWEWQAMHCTSWLLSPVLQELLKPGSNILLFQADYDILSIDAQSRQAEERIFGRVLDDPADYIALTSLQESVRRYLIEGGQVPSAHGRLKSEVYG